MFEEDVARLPAETPRDAALLPGLAFRANFSKSFGFPLLFGLMFMLMPILIMTSDHDAQLSWRGKPARATVVSVTDAEGPRADHMITYSFTPEGAAEFRGTCRCRQGTSYYGVNPGDLVPIRFLPSDPSVNAISDGGNSNEPPFFFFLIFPIFGSLFFFPLYGPQLKSWYRARQAFKNGVITKGSVVFVKRGPPSWPNYIQSSSDVYISFRLPSGESVEGKTLSANEWLLNHLAPGASVNIAYLPSKPTAIVLLDEYLR